MAQVKGTEDRFALDKAAQSAVNGASSFIWNWLPALPYIGWAFKVPPLSWVLNAYRKYQTEALAKRAGNEVGGMIIDHQKKAAGDAYRQQADHMKEVESKPTVTEEERREELDALNDRLGRVVRRRRS